MDPLTRLIRRQSKGLGRLPDGASRSRTSGVLPRRPRAILFDVYGTLFAHVDRPARGRCSSESLIGALITDHGLRTTPRELAALLDRAIAEEHAASRARGIAHPEVRIERVWGGVFPDRSDEELRLMAVSYELAVRPARLVPECRRLIGSLRRMGMILGIVSNAQFYTPLFFAALMGGRPEDIGFSRSLCIYSFEHGRAKPDGALFALAAERLAGMGIGGDDALMVGNDPTNDVVAAAERGFMTALISSPSGPSPSGPSPTARHPAARLPSARMS